MKGILLARLEKIRRAYGTFKQNPTDPEATHQLRVNIRKLRGLMNFMKPVLSENEYVTVNQVLRETGQIYGELRELDVLLVLCREIVAEQPELKVASEELFEFLQSERRKEMARLLKQDIRPNLKAVENTLNRLQLPDKNWDKFVTKRIYKLAENLKKDYKDLDKSDYKKSHKTRIKAKKVRYAADDFNVMVSKDLSDHVAYAEKIQDKLGKITDQYINKQLLKDYSHEVRNPDLKMLFEKMQAYIT